MEHFEQNRTQVKEKSVYVLHLDPTRIVIIGSVIIGLVALAYFGGSYSLKQKEAKPKLAVKSHLMFPSDSSLSVPSAPHSSDMSSLLDNRTSNNLKLAEENNRVMDFTVDRPNEIQVLDKTKVVVPVTPQPPAPRVSPPPQTTVRTPAKTQANTGNARPATQAPQNTRKPEPQTERPATRNTNVVEVSAPLPRAQNTQSGFAIQMGFFDTESRAKRLADTLKSEDYNSYIERVRLNGRDGFRVKIGPFSNRREAITLLNELQEDDRFADCYIVNLK
jgi:cell division septation protein DedD